jgi:hypothetical protein
LKRVVGLIEGIWDFIVGDDWVTAAGVVAALGLTALIAETSSAWWVMPVAVALLLTLSIWREARHQEPR